VTVRPVIFDRNVLAFSIAGFPNTKSH
jgi:hypothetical protein